VSCWIWPSKIIVSQHFNPKRTNTGYCGAGIEGIKYIKDPVTQVNLNQVKQKQKETDTIPGDQTEMVSSQD
jgi:hypothetical protein